MVDRGISHVVRIFRAPSAPKQGDRLYYLVLGTYSKILHLDMDGVGNLGIWRSIVLHS